MTDQELLLYNSLKGLHLLEKAPRDQIVRDYTAGNGLRADGYYGLGQWMFGIVDGTVSAPVARPKDPEDMEAQAAYDAEMALWAELNLDGLTAGGGELPVIVLAAKKNIQLQVNVSPKTVKNKKVTLSVDNEEVVRVKGNGLSGLKPGEAPEALFPVVFRSGLVLREYCNLHGLWSYTIP